MQLPGIVTIHPTDTELLLKTARMMGTSFMEENWFKTWFKGLDVLGVPASRKEELMQAVFLDELSAHVPFEGVYVLPDVSAATGAYRYSELQGHTHEELTNQSYANFEKIATKEELALLNRQKEKMARISDFDWSRKREHEKDHIYFYAWAVDPQARGTGALRRLLDPFFTYADEQGLNCYLECYADKLQHMYEHLGFEILEEVYDPAFDIYERKMLRPAH